MQYNHLSFAVASADGPKEVAKEATPRLQSVRKVLKRKIYAKPCALTPHVSTSRHHFARKQ